MSDILKFDNFADDAAQVRAAVIAQGFTTEVGPDGAVYTGISQYAVPHWYIQLSELLRRPIQPRLACFRLNLAGELPHSWVHSDGLCAQFATVVYMNLPEQCQGGTAFWRHKTLGIDRMPSPSTPEFDAFISNEWKLLDRWEPTGFVPMQWNTLVTYPTSLFHSRYPFEGFGTGPADGRLIWVCFYDI